MGDEHKPEEPAEPGVVSGFGVTTDITGEQHPYPEPLDPEDIRTYTVQPGDTLASIAQRFYGDPRKVKPIIDANRDRLENGVREGDLLRIPVED